MNTENRFNVTPSLFMLRELKRRQEHVNKGYHILRKKFEALRLKGRQIYTDLATTHGILGHTLKEAYISLAAIKFTNGESNALVLENVGQAAQVRVHKIVENISGVSTVTLQAIENRDVDDCFQYAGLGAGGHRTMEAKVLFRNVIKILVSFASLRSMCVLIDEAMKSTMRKINSIEKITLPKLKNTEKYILTEMDEREREDYYRLKMMKNKKMRANALLHARNSLKSEIDRDTLPGSTSSTIHIRSLERLSTAIYPCPITTELESAGDCKPNAPNFWEDEDMLF